MSNELTIDLVREWLDASAKPSSCGYGPNGPHVQVLRPNGEMANIDLRTVCDKLLATMQREAKLREALAMVRKDKWFPAMLEQHRITVVEALGNEYPDAGQ